MGDTFRYEGTLTYSTPRRCSGARAAFEGLLGTGLLTAQDVTWTPNTAHIRCSRHGTMSQGADDLAAITAMAKPAKTGFIDAILLGLRAGERVLPKAKTRSILPDESPTQAGHPLTRPRHPNHVFHLAATPDLLALGGGVTGYQNQDADVTVWDLATATQLHRFAGIKKAVTALAISPDGQWVAAGNRTGTVRLWSLTGQKHRSRRLGRGIVQSLHFSDDSQHIAAVLPSAGLFTSSLELTPAAIKHLVDERYIRLVRWLDTGNLLYARFQQVDVITPSGALTPYRDKLPAGLIPTGLHTIGDRALAFSGTMLSVWSLSKPGRPEVLSRADLPNNETFRAAQLTPSGRVEFVSGRYAGWWEPTTRKRALIPLTYHAAYGFCVPGALAGVSGQGINCVIDPATINASTTPKPGAPPPTPWSIKTAAWDAEGLTCDKPGAEWIWKKTEWGHEGVHTHEGQVLWYSHSENRHAGGGAAGQSYEDFLENGPRISSIPDELLKALYVAVKTLRP